MRLGRFYPILDLDLARARGWEAAELARGLAGLGVSLLQLRAKRLDAGEFCLAARAVVDTVQAMPQAPAVIVNDRADVALLSGAQGLHLGQDDLPLAAARRLLPEAATIGVSTHTLDQVEHLLDDSWVTGVPAHASRPAPRSNYIAFGPIFPTTTKLRADPVTGLEALRAVRRIYGGPLVAIGGITLANRRAVYDAGADAVAVIGGWMSAPDPIAAAARWLAAAS